MKKLLTGLFAVLIVCTTPSSAMFAETSDIANNDEVSVISELENSNHPRPNSKK